MIAHEKKTAHNDAPPREAKPAATNQFAKLGLAGPLLRATEKLGYETPTPIQAEAIPVVLSGRDLIGCAQTGTGKTAAFTLPTLDRLLQSLPPRPPKAERPAQPLEPKHKMNKRGKKGANPKPRALRGLVLSPTRELAAQIGESFGNYGAQTPLRHTVVYGGVSQFHQVRALRHGVDVLVATPGRLLDLMQQGYIKLDKVEVLIFDEADQMLDMGFLPDLRRIVAQVPDKRQTLMFSATMPKEIRELAQQWLTEPASIEVARVGKPADRIAQSLHFVDKKKKPELLAKLLHETPRGRTLVFTRTKHGADKTVKHLDRKGIRAAAIHGNKSQGARTRALAQFKGKNPPVLVATDIAARGLDIDDVSHIINFDLPEVAETYVHRIGRTARAGAEGVSISFCAGDERGLLKQIERLTKKSIPVEPTIEGFEPTDPISHGSPTGWGKRQGGNQQRGGGQRRGGQGGGSKRGGKPGAKAKRYGSKPAGAGKGPATGGGTGKPRRRKSKTGGSTAPTAAQARRKKANSAGGAGKRPAN